MMIFNRFATLRIALIVSITAIAIAFTGALTYAWVYHISQHASVVGWAGYAMIAITLMAREIIRTVRFETVIDDVHSMVADVSAEMSDLKSYVERNI